MPSDSLESLQDLFTHELRDLYDAENQLVKALPAMSRAAQSPELKRAFDTHLRETKEQVRRIEQVFRGLGEKPSGKSCKAMQGLVAEAKELLEEDAEPAVLDAALIVAAQKVEHYEIAGYGSVCTFGRILGYDDAVETLKQTMDEEERTDELLTQIAMELNIEAETTEGSSQSDSSREMTDRPMTRTTVGSRGRSRTSSTSNRGGSSNRSSNRNGATKKQGSRRSSRARSTAQTR